MARTFADETVETSNTTGTGAYNLEGAKGDYLPFSSTFTTGDQPAYGVRNSNNTKWELNRGAAFSAGSPNTLARGVWKSTNGNAPVSWTSDDLPLTVYVPASAEVHEGVVIGWLASARHALLRAGGAWWDYTLGIGTTWIEKLYTGSADIEKGRAHLVSGIFVASPRKFWQDIGAAGKTLDSADIGKVLLFDCTAGARTFTLLAGATSGIGHGFTCWVLGYGGTAGVVLDPDGTEIIDAGSAGANLTVPPNTLTLLSWDGAKSRWRTDLMGTANFPAGTIVQRAYAEYLTNTNLSTVIPGDDTIPQVGEGTEILSAAITPLKTGNRVRVRVKIWGQCADVSQYGIMALFRNGGANAIQAAAGFQSQLIGALTLEYEDSPASVSAQTYSVRVGASVGAVRLNGGTGGRLFGGASRCTMVIEEIQQ